MPSVFVSFFRCGYFLCSVLSTPKSALFVILFYLSYLFQLYIFILLYFSISFSTIFNSLLLSDATKNNGPAGDKPTSMKIAVDGVDETIVVRSKEGGHAMRT